MVKLGRLAKQPFDRPGVLDDLVSSAHLGCRIRPSTSSEIHHRCSRITTEEASFCAYAATFGSEDVGLSEIVVAVSNS